MLTLTFQKVELLSLLLPLSSVKSWVPQLASCSSFHSVQGSDETIRVVSMDRDYHVECYHCEVGPSLPRCPKVQEKSIPGLTGA